MADRGSVRSAARASRRVRGRPVRVGQLAFGVGFLLVGMSWFSRSAGVDLAAAWIVAIVCLVGGIAGIVGVLRSLRGG